ncbi:uncharacterized protein PV09_03444 [Verruconis gallopava]|uniref:Uncharacterized protein n=1 Tax=Verruconis gallopava TaxID=253628 RepID=A0A0D2B2R6_9PEZI|nr:uncharacterized protein PV09_03444 [Verruconis gallopava]KIW05569.1 hypothetical protein PV09_03444 [Verruconis gallopava]
MFSFLGGSSSLLAARHDPTKERPAPPYPTPVSFPRLESFREAPHAWTEGSAPDLFKHYSRIRKLSDVSTQHLAALNVSLRDISHDFDDFFSTNELAHAFVPPASWLEPSAAPSSALPALPGQSRVLSNGRPFPSQQDFSIRSKELRHTNEDAYRALTRTPHNGQPPARLAHFRRFWEALDNMNYYWDTSCDEYIPEGSVSQSDNGRARKEESSEDADEAVVDTDEPRKRVRPNPQPDTSGAGFELPVGPAPPSGELLLDIRPPKVPGSAEKPPGTYRGNRIGNGAGMPESYRTDAARAFVEPIAWSFGFTMAAHRKPPVLEIKSLLVPIKLSGTVWRPPNEREKARAGCLQGPVLGISCRSETEFAEGKADPVLDVLRELGAMLCLAQERAREGRTERKPGENRWWTSVPRWGGGPGGEMGEAITSSDDDIEPGGEEKTAPNSETKARANTRGTSSKRKQAIINAWKTLRVGSGYWDPRVDYAAVGKPPGSKWDEIYLVSSLNHHISILRLRVHDDYIHYLLTGDCPKQVTDPEWSTPVLSRSRWFDLFTPEDRLEAFRLLWGIMGYLARVD